MGCKYIYQGKSYEKDEFIAQVIPQFKNRGKTRRILELQSDLFQKERGKDILSTNIGVGDSSSFAIGNTLYETNGEDYYSKLENGKEVQINKSEFDVAFNSLNNKADNQFLQLLMKDNNWVSFFVKSIVNDSINRGYEKVLFPSGNTASKVEGHTTIEEFVAQKQNRIDIIKQNIADLESESVWAKSMKDYANEDDYFSDFDMDEESGYIPPTTKESTARQIASLNNEIDTLEKEISTTQTGGIAALKPIYTFYETNVKNIVTKLYGATQVTDEYGNTWNEVNLATLKPDATKILFNRTDTKGSFENRATNFLLTDKIVTRKGDKLVIEGANRSERLEKIENINQSYYELHGFFPFTISKTDEGFEIGIDSSILDFQGETDSKAIGQVTELLEKLKDKTGIDYEVISSSRAYEIADESGVIYNGEPAFFLGNKVYLLQDRLTSQNAIHEFSHPFILALRASNPELAEKLYADLKSLDDPAINQIIEDVRRLYPGPENATFQDEVLVRVMTAHAQKELNSKGFLAWVKKLWFQFKQMLRKVFGQGIALEALDENTTLQDLAKMLVLGNQKIDLSESQSDMPLFNREMAAELEKIESSKLIVSIDNFSETLKDHLRKLRRNQNFSELQKILKNENDGSIISDANQLMKAAQDLEKDIDTKFKKLRSFSEAILGVVQVSEKMRKYVETFPTSGMDEATQLRVLTYYGYMVNDWTEVFG